MNGNIHNKTCFFNDFKSCLFNLINFSTMELAPIFIKKKKALQLMSASVSM